MSKEDVRAVVYFTYKAKEYRAVMKIDKTVTIETKYRDAIGDPSWVSVEGYTTLVEKLFVGVVARVYDPKNNVVDIGAID